MARCGCVWSVSGPFTSSACGLQQDPVSGVLSIHNMLLRFSTYLKCLAFMFPGQGSHVG